MRHITSMGHPEQPERLAAIERLFEERGLSRECQMIDPTPATREDLLQNHSRRYLDHLMQACVEGDPYVDTTDCPVSAESYHIAKLACGGVIKAADLVQRGNLKNAFCAVRPPGHHAEYGRAMGFCLINNVAVTARYLLARYGLERILILDWDMHHGNGTFHAFEETDQVFFCSLHGHPNVFYPGTGRAEERGKGYGEGFSLNIPLWPGTSDHDYRLAFEQQFLPEADKFAPQFILISAGFDAHRDDPLSAFELETETFGWMTAQVCSLAKKHCGGKIVSALEGGYNLRTLAECAALHVETLLK